MNRRGAFLCLSFAALIAGGAACSSSGGTAVTEHPTPTPTPSSGVTLGTLGNVSCTAPDNTVPGTYASIDTEGTVSGTTYMQGTGGGSGWNTNAATAPGASPAPTSAPIVYPSVPPSTSGAVIWIVYYGEYAVPSTSGLTTAISNGCFVMPTQATATGSDPTSFVAVGQGLTTFGAPYPTESDAIAQGPMTSFTITNLTRTSGTGTFVMNTAILGNVQSVTGTLNITGSTAFYSTDSLLSTSILRRANFQLRRP